MEYQRGEGVLFATEELATGTKLTLHAKDLRNERGPHAVVSIIAQGAGARRSLAWDDLALNKAEERLRLANKAARQLEPADKIALDASSTDMGLLVDDFCAGLWEAWVAILEPALFAGATTRIAPDFLLRPFIAKGKGAILYSPPKAGKSYLGDAIAVAIDSGQTGDIFLPTLAPRHAMIINLERDAASKAQRLHAINKVLGLSPDRPIVTLNAKGKRFSDVIGAVRRVVKRERIEFGVLDSLSRVGMKLLDESEVNAACDLLNDTFPSWLALGHTPRADTSHLFGSVMFEAAADVLLQHTSVRDDNAHTLGIRLRMSGSNDLPGFAPLLWRLTFDDMGLVAWERSTLMDLPDLAKDLPQDVKAQLIEYLRDKSRATATEAADELSLERSRVGKLLRSDRAFQFAGQEGRNKFYGLRANERDVAV